MHDLFHLVAILVADGQYLGAETRKLLWLCESSYNDRELLRAIVFTRENAHRDRKRLLTHNIIVQNARRVDLLLTAGCSPNGEDFSHAVHLADSTWWTKWSLL
jgi:hypothetical protein